MDHIIFSRNAQEITLLLPNLQESPSPLLQSLAHRIDNGIDGSIRKLELSNKIMCWKLPDTTTTQSLELPPTINIGYFRSAETQVPFLRSLRLDQLQSLEVDTILNRDMWWLLGDLPHLTILRVVSNERSLPIILLRGVFNLTPDPDTSPAFVALQRLTIASWALKSIANKQNKSSIQILTYCLKHRMKAGLPLRHLRLEDCRADEDGLDENDLVRLRNQGSTDEEASYSSNHDPNH
ncbi:hypothetical protein C0995_012375 [Termitomyces sp. Mi166|nr:hypothetical protein C0995_012375 [Termitomyces sp. Mi166\